MCNLAAINMDCDRCAGNVICIDAYIITFGSPFNADSTAIALAMHLTCHRSSNALDMPSPFHCTIAQDPQYPYRWFNQCKRPAHGFVLPVLLLGLLGCIRQAALERQDLFCPYLAHHELESL